MNRIEICVNKCNDSRQGEMLKAACHAALTAGSLLKTLFHKPHTITMKGVTDLVTEADVAAEAAIIASLEEDVPGIPIMAEESSAKDIKSVNAETLIVDPLDGTTNYAHGIPLFAVSIALLNQSGSTVGVTYLPMFDELFCACKGVGAWLNGEPIQVTRKQFLLESLVATGFPYDIHPYLPEITHQIKTLLPKVRDIRRMGAAAVDLAYLACGRVDAFYEKELQPWDTAAGWLLVEEAGGKVSDYSGAPYSPFTKEIVATNGSLHEDLLKQLRMV